MSHNEINKMHPEMTFYFLLKTGFCLTAVMPDASEGLPIQREGYHVW